MRSSVLRSAFLLLLGASAWAGCGDPLSLNPATIENTVDTTFLFATSLTPVTDPSGFQISSKTVVRLDQVNTFDFLYDVNPAGEHYFLPLAALINTGKTTGNAGFRLATSPFDSITIAEQSDYVSSDTVFFRIGDVFYARSQVESSCSLGIPYYAKLQILAIDDSAYRVKFRFLVNTNCGYRGLSVGLPTK
jgi:hypothetical protein